MMRTWNGWGGWLARGVWVGVVAAALSGCEMLLPKDSPAARAGDAGTVTRLSAGTKKRPFMVARVCYQAPERFDALAGRADDSSRPSKGLMPFGNGTLEMGIEDGQGRLIEGLESGGSLLVPGVPGADYRLVLKNASRSPLEVRVRVDGRDLFSGETDAWDHAGAEIEPGKTLVLDQGWRSGAPAFPLTFAAVPDLNAPLDFQPRGRVGLIQVGVFTLDEVDGMTTAAPQAGWRQEVIPFTPRTVPHQYR